MPGRNPSRSAAAETAAICSTLPRFAFRPVQGKLLFPFKPVPAGLVRSGIDVEPIGWILVALGLAGIATSLVVWRGFPLRAS